MTNNGATTDATDAAERPRSEDRAQGPLCLNCDTPLRGQYCAECGQRSQTRLISLWQLLREAFGDLLELDSRLWRTLRPLLLKPGQLTREYLNGRRARYMPPFRTYLVLSVLFFVIVFFIPQDDLSLLFEPEPEPTAEEAAATEEIRQARIDAAQEELDALADDPDVPEEVKEAIAGTSIEEQVNKSTGDSCIKITTGVAKFSDWFARRLTPERVQDFCRRIEFDGGASVRDQFVDKIPLALIVLLPLMALALKFLYPFSRRYFVEHLLFFVHFHAFFFLMLTLQILLMRTAGLLRIPDAIPILIVTAASFYIPFYLYISMRRVYGQGHIFTAIKFVVLLAAYILGVSLTLLSTVLVALLSV